MGIDDRYTNYVMACIGGDGEHKRRLAVPIEIGAYKDELEAIDAAITQLRTWVKKAIKDRNKSL